MLNPTLRNLLLLIVSTSWIMACGQPESSSHSELSAVWTTSNSAGILEMNTIERTRLFASISGAVYCGDDTPCTVQDRYNRNIRYFARNYNLEGWRMAFATARDLEKDVEGFVFFHPEYDDVIIAFRGSEMNVESGAIQDWLKTNARVFPTFFPGRRFSGNVHQGFLEAMYGIWHPNDTGLVRILNEFQLWDKRFWLTGHSLGGAVAALVGMRIADESKQVAGIYTFGAPKIGKYDFQWSFNRALQGVTHQFVNAQDPVPHIPANMVAVGQTFEFRNRNLQVLNKDGAPPWDPLTVLFEGRPEQHEIDTRSGLSYLDSLYRLR